MIGATVRLKATGALCMVRRDGIGNDGVRRLRLRSLDDGSLLFVEPSEVEELAQPATSTGPTKADKPQKVKPDAEVKGDD